MLLTPMEATDYANAITQTFAEKFPTSNGRLIFVGIGGSRAYGTSRPDSDYDIRGAFINPPDEIMGCLHFTDEVTVTMPPIKDGIIFSYTKLFKLFMNGNPNVLELLFLPADCILCTSPEWDKVMANRNLFLSKKVAKSFYGYAVAQHHRMTVADSSTRKLGERRKGLIEKYGYDVKQASHVIRLLQMGAELLVTGTMAVRRPWVGDLMRILEGCYTRTEIDTWVSRELEEFKKAEAASILPDEVDTAAVNALHVEFCRKVVG